MITALFSDRFIVCVCVVCVWRCCVDVCAVAWKQQAFCMPLVWVCNSSPTAGLWFSGIRLVWCSAATRTNIRWIHLHFIWTHCCSFAQCWSLQTCTRRSREIWVCALIDKTVKRRQTSHLYSWARILYLLMPVNSMCECVCSQGWEWIYIFFFMPRHSSCLPYLLSHTFPHTNCPTCCVALALNTTCLPSCMFSRAKAYTALEIAEFCAYKLASAGTVLSSP